MSERTNTQEQPALPDLELIQIVEGMTGHERIQEKRRLLQEISDRESLVHLINEVNEVEGIDVTILY